MYQICFEKWNNQKRTKKATVWFKEIMKKLNFELQYVNTFLVEIFFIK